MRVCSFTTVPDVRLRVDEREYRFEFSRQFGPAMIGKRGNTVEWMPPHRDPFWRALAWWAHQGCRVENGFAVYDMPGPVVSRWLRVTKRDLFQDTPEMREQLAAYGLPIEAVETTDEPWPAAYLSTDEG